MHGLAFETSICYWQDQPGSPRCVQRAETAPAGSHGALRGGAAEGGCLEPHPRGPTLFLGEPEGVTLGCVGFEKHRARRTHRRAGRERTVTGVFPAADVREKIT